MKLTILGCGPSSGVPATGGFWGDCNPLNPKNRRLRSSLLIEDQGKTILIDTSPDLRQQLLTHNIRQINSVLYTHDHGDHVHGIDDLRPLYFHNERQTIPVYGDTQTLNSIKKRFFYLFKITSSLTNQFPVVLEGREFQIEKDKKVPPFRIEHLNVQPFWQGHGPSYSVGYRIGSVAYSTDVSELNDTAFQILEGVDTWIVSCLSLTAHATHAHLEQSLSWIKRVNPRRAILTHMGQTMDYDTLYNQLPQGIMPAYDGLTLTL